MDATEVDLSGSDLDNVSSVDRPSLSIPLDISMLQPNFNTSLVPSILIYLLQSPLMSGQQI